MKITVFGATGSVGRAVVEQAMARGHDVRAFVRDPATELAPSVVAVVGDLGDADTVARAVEGSDAVVWAVGATKNSSDQVALFETGALNLVTTMKRYGIRRLVALSGAGITIDGERKPLRGRFMSAFVARIVRHVVESKRREYEVFKASGLDWTMVRPPRVVPGAARGYAAGERLEGRSVTTGDLADFMVAQLGEETNVGKAPYIASTK